MPFALKLPGTELAFERDVECGVAFRLFLQSQPQKGRALPAGQSLLYRPRITTLSSSPASLAWSTDLRAYTQRCLSCLRSQPIGGRGKLR